MVTFHRLALAERPDGLGVRGEVLDATTTDPGNRSRCQLLGQPRGLRSWSTLLLRRMSTRLRRSPDPASARSSNWAYCTCSTRQTTKPAMARPPVVSAERRAKDRTGRPWRWAEPGLGGNRGGNEVGTNRVPSWLLLSPRVLSELGALQGIPHGKGNAGQVERPSTEPKVSGSNPDGRAQRERALGRGPFAFGWGGS
jgi:hypothetical protein